MLSKIAAAEVKSQSMEKATEVAEKSIKAAEVR